MEMATKIMAVAGLALVGLYTANYAVWAWQRRMRLGAVGLAALTVLVLVFPLFLLFGR